MGKINLKGQKFGRWTVVKKSDNRGWDCVCDCGRKGNISLHDLNNKKSRSCGCLRTETTKKRATTHGMGKSRIYGLWSSMKTRCQNSKHSSYKDYGSRGIKVCKEWKNFENFLKWAKNNGYDDTLTIERKDVNGNYCPKNCTWIPRKEQYLNRTDTVSYRGEIAKQASLRLGGKPGLVSMRLRSGWSKKDAFTTPASASNNKNNIKYKGEIAKHASIRLGGGHSLVSLRLKKGWSMKDAFTIPVTEKYQRNHRPK